MAKKEHHEHHEHKVHHKVHDHSDIQSKIDEGIEKAKEQLDEIAPRVDVEKPKATPRPPVAQAKHSRLQVQMDDLKDKLVKMNNELRLRIKKTKGVPRSHARLKEEIRQTSVKIGLLAQVLNRH